MPEVDHPAGVVGQPAVVEDLQEDVPDVRVRLLELVEQHDREGVLAQRRDEAGGGGVGAGALGEQPLEALRRLELAHVEPHEPRLRAEHRLGERLGELRLAGPGGADEEEDAERAARIREPRLEQRDALDQAVDCLGLSQHPRRERLAQRVDVDRLAWVEQLERHRGRGGERLDHERRRHRARALPRGALAAHVEQAQQVARRGQPRQVVLGEVGRLAKRRLVDLDRAARLAHAAPDRQRLVRGHRREADHLEQLDDLRAPLDELLVGGGVDLADQPDASRLEVREERVEQPARMTVVLARVEGLLEPGDDPDHVAMTDAVDELLDALLQLPDVDGARDHLRGSRPQHGPVVVLGQLAERVAHDRGLPDAALAHDEQRSAGGRLREPRAQALDGLPPGGDDHRVGPRVAPHEAADEAQELVVLELGVVVLPHVAIFLHPRRPERPRAGIRPPGASSRPAASA